ncbi:hypothetical protein HMPREF9446_01611 [Bacteroides fluxus YIT 12057]|uniref:Uncharacterized protein n=1 Tax=Bacteroides fluxus YIT 12057 TaxID=763034 RepID=F3PS78_9BACE|nr:hypothetical protein HMPREF9446_01611 [Bacteroides fluxus YIT 12057]
MNNKHIIQKHIAGKSCRNSLSKPTSEYPHPLAGFELIIKDRYILKK